MKVFIKYISFIYLKYFFIVFLALELFFVAIDVLNNLALLPKSANLVVLFVVFSAASAVPFLLPLSLVFALIISLILLLRSGELVAFYALGVSKNALIKPVFIISCVITGLFVLLQCTPAAYAKDVKNSILELNSKNFFSFNSAFIKNKNNFIYFATIDELNKTAPFAYIFEIEDAKLVKKVLAMDVSFSKDKWIAKTAYTQILPTDLALGKTALSYEASMNYEVLEGFEPRLLSNLNRSATSYSIIHAIATIYQTIGDNINIALIKTSLYLSIFFPFFAPFGLLALYYYAPAIPRYSNLALLGFGFVISTLCVWGLLYVLSRLSSSGTLNAELAIIAPIVVLGSFAYIKFRQAR